MTHDPHPARYAVEASGGGPDGWRLTAAFLLLVLLEIFAVHTAVHASPSNPFSFIVLIAALSPLLVMAVMPSPGSVLLAVPLLALIPATVFSFSIFELFFLFVLFAAALRGAASERRPAPLGLVEIVFLLYVLWAAVTLTQAVDRTVALGGFKRIVIAFLAFYAGRHVLGPARARPLLRIYALLAVAIGIQLVVVIRMKGYSIELLATRILGFTDLGWGQSNYVAATAALAACGAVVLALFGRGWERTLGLAGMVGALLVQIVTMSRGGALALFGGLLLAGLFETRRRLLPILTITGAMGVAIFLSPLGRILLERFTAPSGLTSVGIRFLFYREALIIARENWLFGVGPDQIPYHTAFYMDANPHNFLLKNAADHGMVGAALFVVLVAILVVRALRRRASATTGHERIVSLALVLALGVGLLNAAYEPTLAGSIYSFLFWLLIGVLTGRRPPDRDGRAAARGLP